MTDLKTCPGCGSPGHEVGPTENQAECRSCSFEASIDDWNRRAAPGEGKSVGNPGSTYRLGGVEDGDGNPYVERPAIEWTREPPSEPMSCLVDGGDGTVCSMTVCAETWSPHWRRSTLTVQALLGLEE